MNPIKFNINRRELIAALKVVNRVTDQNGSKPVLSNVRIETGGQGITISATDYEHYLELSIPAQVESAGEITLPSRKVIKLLQGFKSDRVEFDYSDPDFLWVSIISPQCTVRLPFCDPGLYPSWDADVPARFEIDGAELDRAIELTITCCQTDETRKNLMGTHLTVRDGTATFTATDGHRLAHIHKPVDMKSTDFPEIILPRAFLETWEKALKWSGADQPVAVHYDERHFSFHARDCMMGGRVIEGRFPHIESMIPQSYEHSFQIPPKEFAEMIAGVAVMSSERIKPVKLALIPGQVSVQSERAEYGDTTWRHDVCYDGETFTIGFNGAYVLDVLKGANGHKSVTVEFNGPLHPIGFTFPDEPGYQAVVMPLRIEW